MPRATKPATINRHALALALGMALFAPQAFPQTLTLSANGENTARSEDYPNYTDMVIDKGIWHLYGPLVSTTSSLKGGAKILLNDGTNLGAGLTTIDGATLQAEASFLELNQQLRLQVGGLTVDGPNVLSFNNTVLGGGGLNKIGTGELILRKTNTYSSYTMIGNGVLNVQANNATSTGVLSFNGTGNGVLRSTSQNVWLGNFYVNMASSGTFDTQTDLLINGRIGGNGLVTKTGAGRLRFTGPWVNMGDVVLRDGTIDMGTNGELGGGSLIVYKGSLDSDIDQTFYNPIVLNGALNMVSARNWNFAGDISGAGDLEWNSASTLTLSGNNTITGAVGLNDGTLVVASNQALGTSRLILNGGVLTNSQILTNTISPLDVKRNSLIRAAYDWSLNGELTGDASVTKTGSGLVTFGGATTNFTGGLFVQQGGTNVVQSYSGHVGVSNAATLQMGDFNDDVIGDYIDGYLNLGAGDDQFGISAQNLSGLVGQVEGGAGNNTLNIFNTNGLYEVTLSGSQFSNFGVLNLDGPVGLTLNGPASFVSSDPSVVGVTVNTTSFLNLNGATLTTNRANVLGGLFGEGVIDGDVNTSGIVAPSGAPTFSGVRAEKSSMGTLRVTGDLNTTSGQWFIHTTDSGTSDQVIVNGTANISGATVVALPQTGTYADRTVYSFLRAGHVVGAFNGVVQNTFAFLNASLETHTDGVDLILERSVPPVVVPPVVQPPVTQPVVEPPVVVPPVVQPPVTQPVVEPPVVVPPVVQPPVTQPVVEPPVVVPPVVQPPVTQPVVEPQVVQPPVAPVIVIVPSVTEPPLSPVGEGVAPTPGHLRYDEFSGLTRNQRSMAHALQESEWRNAGELNELLGEVRALQKDEVIPAFDQLTGESFAALRNAEADALQYVLDLMNQREIEEGLAIWGDALWFETPLDRNGDTNSVQNTSQGFAVGMDLGGEHLRGGVFVTQNEGDLNAFRSEKIKSQRVGGGVRAQFTTDRWELRATGIYSQTDMDTSRTIGLGANPPRTTTAATQAKSLGAAMQARYNLIRKKWALTSILEASYASTTLNGFTEKGASSALRIGSSTSTQKIVAMGVGAAKNIAFTGSNIRLYVDVKYNQILNPQNPTTTASFAANTIEFELVGSQRERQWWNTVVGADVRSKSWTFSAQAQADLVKAAPAYKINIGATYHFK